MAGQPNSAPDLSTPQPKAVIEKIEHPASPIEEENGLPCYSPISDLSDFEEEGELHTSSIDDALTTIFEEDKENDREVSPEIIGDKPLNDPKISQPFSPKKNKRADSPFVPNRHKNGLLPPPRDSRNKSQASMRSVFTPIRKSDSFLPPMRNFRGKGRFQRRRQSPYPSTNPTRFSQHTKNQNQGSFGPSPPYTSFHNLPFKINHYPPISKHPFRKGNDKIIQFSSNVEGPPQFLSYIARWIRHYLSCAHLPVQLRCRNPICANLDSLLRLHKPFCDKQDCYDQFCKLYYPVLTHMTNCPFPHTCDICS